ncbi:hypothetical protein PR202_ga28103 [Eleusine coracana subsp. coracana]|uniref:F-box associated domain-containing protein n=1 Tax=Eleusine coracana subsp. coracana TaxID=191504 RepID=A0AAV5DGV8_ELECO|nr:hypothetical protein PR202_ga28103 [Eleusine coracana subsp. coracana]
MDCSKRSAMAGIPDDALVEILSLLPAKFLCRSNLETPISSSSSEDWSSDYCVSVDGQHYVSDDSNNCSGEDSDSFSCEDTDKSGSIDKNSPPGVHGHFINLLGKPASLVDASFSFLKSNPRIGTITLLDSCGGLLLLGNVRDMDMCDNETPGYIVCNPATERWALVPSSGCIWTALEEPLFEEEPLVRDDTRCDWQKTNVATYLTFDPAISQHFQLIEFCHTSELGTVHTYSSETGLWNDRTRQRREWKRGGKWEMHKTITSMSGSIFFNKMLHLVIIPRKGRELIAAIDGEGKTCKTIRWLENHSVPVFVGESKGLLHCVSVSGHPEGNSCNMTELSMWVLEDYCAEEWKLKHTVSFQSFLEKRVASLAQTTMWLPFVQITIWFSLFSTGTTN